MERRKASPEQLNMLLHFLEEDKELAIGKITGLEARIRQTNAWIKITEKLNANSGFGSGAIKTPDKWQQVTLIELFSNSCIQRCYSSFVRHLNELLSNK